MFLLTSRCNVIEFHEYWEVRKQSISIVHQHKPSVIECEAPFKDVESDYVLSGDQ
jgi:hypothetical protein